MTMLRTARLLAVFSLTASSALAQVVPRALIISDDEVPGSPGRVNGTVTRIAPSHLGGVVATLSTRSFTGSDTDFQLWGSQGDTSLTRLERSDPNGPLQITRFDDTAGLNGTQVATLARTGSSNAVVADGQVIARSGATTGPGGSAWTTFIGLRLDATGTPWFQARYSGALSGAGFFRGTTPVFLSGDTISGMPGVVSPAAAPAPGFDVTFDGAHWLAVVRTTANVRSYVVRDGAVLSAGGVLLETGATLPVSFQLSPNETYNSFGMVQMASNDRWAVTGGTPSEFIIRDGDMYRRDGDVVDGRALSNGIGAIALDATGSIAWTGRIDLVGSTNPVAVFREDTFLFQEGDGVDVNGDGAPDAGYSVLTIFGDRGRLVLSEDGAVYSLVRLNTPSGQRNALVAADLALATPYCSSAVNAVGERARMQTSGSTRAADNDVELRCVDMPTNAFGLFITSRTAGFVSQPGGSLGDLCLGGTIGRFNASIQNSGPAATIAYGIDTGAIPEGGATSSATAGSTWHFQCWFRDLDMGVPASNFSDAVALTFR